MTAVRASDAAQDDEPGLSGTVDLDADWVRVVLHGELDLATCRQVDAALRLLLAAGHTSIEVDLGDVDFLDCAGARPLRAAATAATTGGGAVRIVNPSPLARLVLGLTGSGDEKARPA